MKFNEYVTRDDGGAAGGMVGAPGKMDNRSGIITAPREVNILTRGPRGDNPVTQPVKYDQPVDYQAEFKLFDEFKRHLGMSGSGTGGGSCVDPTLGRGVAAQSGIRPLGRVEGPAPGLEGYTQAATGTHSAPLGSSYQDYLRWHQQQQAAQQASQQAAQGQQQQQLYYWDGTSFVPQPRQQQHSSATHTLRTGLQSAGIDYGSLGLLADDLGDVFQPQQQGAAGNWMEGMRVLMGMGDRRRSYQWLRPENNLKVSKKYIDMTYQDLMFGMGRVIDQLRAGKSPLPFPTITLEGYMKHFRFVSLKGLATNFRPGVLNEYEHEVTSKVMEGSIPDFVGGEHDCVVENLGADSTKSANPPSERPAVD